LPTLSGLESLTSVVGDVVIQNNPQLSLCATESICRLLTTLPANRKTISDNAPGCATLAEVEANCAGPAITGFAASPNPVCAGSSVSFTATVSNVVTPYSFTLTNGSSPLSGTANMSAFSQMLTASGSGAQSFTLTVSASGRSTTAITSVTVNAVTVSNPTVSTATQGQPFSQTFTASGGATPYRFRVEGGDSILPTGLSLSTSGILSGTPTQTGNFPFVVRATDDASAACEGSGTTYTLRVNPPVVVSQPIRYVRQGGTGDGTSWATASGNLQSQIDAPGVEQVWVAAGLYKPTTTTGPNSRTISFSMKNGVAIYGGFPATGDPTFAQRGAVNPVTGQPSSSTLSGDIGTVGDNTDNTYNVIYNGPGLTLTAILDGFVITGGNANNNQLNFGSRRGGGVYNDGGAIGQICSPTIRNCLFQHNAASNGGSALYNDASNGSASPQLTNCVFESNTGGAIFNNSDLGASSPVITNCSFLNNAGGGIYINVVQENTVSQLTLTGCLFKNNSASEGGAIFGDYEIGAAQQNNIIRITNCVFEGNSASTGGGAVTGLGNNRYEVVGSTFRNNSASGDKSSGGAIYSADPTMTFTNCLFEGNSATRSGGG